MAIHIKLDCSKAIEKLKGKYRIIIDTKVVQVYIPEGDHIDFVGRSMPISKLVSILVNGNPSNGAPPRPFTTDAGLQLKHQLIALLRAHTSIIVKDTRNANSLGTIRVTYDDSTIGMVAETLIKHWITSGVYYRAVAPNAPSTIANKGHDIPLVHTGNLVNSISHKTKTT